MQGTAEERGKVGLALDERDLDPFREMLRQQLLGDQELMRDAVAGRADPDMRAQLYDRICMVRRLGDALGLPAKHMERRHGPRRGRGARGYAPGSLYVVPLSALWIPVGLILATAAVVAMSRAGVTSIPAVYVPVVAYATRRFGKRVGLLTVAASAVAFFSLDILDAAHDARGGIAFGAMLLWIWVIRRDVF